MAVVVSVEARVGAGLWLGCGGAGFRAGGVDEAGGGGGEGHGGEGGSEGGRRIGLGFSLVGVWWRNAVVVSAVGPGWLRVCGRGSRGVRC